MDNDTFLQIELIEEVKNFRLKLFFNKDQKGIIYRVTSGLFANNWSILSANIKSLEHGQVEDEFLIHQSDDHQPSLVDLDILKKEIEQLFLEEISVPSYLIKKGKKANIMKGNQNAKVLFESVDNQDMTKLHIQTKDRTGLLFDITRILYLECIDILSVKANTFGNTIDDLFAIKSETGHHLDENMQSRLIRNLKNIL